MRERLPETDEVTLLSFCPYDRYMPMLRAAEYVFYWNAMSLSSIVRSVNEQPLFFFDRGHWN